LIWLKIRQKSKRQGGECVIDMDLSTRGSLAEMICGDDTNRFPSYRSGSELTRFFQRVGFSNFVHDGTTRKWWMLEVLKQLSDNNLHAVIRRLADPLEYGGDKDAIKKAIGSLNKILGVEGFQVELEGISPKLKRFSEINFDLDSSPDEFKPLPPPDFLALKIDSNLGQILANRWQEVQRCVDCESYLAATILMGSLLEGILLSVVCQYPKEANLSLVAPKDSENNRVLKFYEWTLAQMIDVAHDLRWIDLDVKKFSHSLRGFRNFIHPHQQMLQDSYPDKDTCAISWYVVQAAITDLVRHLKT